MQFAIRRVIIGEHKNFRGNEAFLRAHGVEVTVLDDPQCIALMARFIEERPDPWFEDVAGNEGVGVGRRFYQNSLHLSDLPSWWRPPFFELFLIWVKFAPPNWL